MQLVATGHRCTVLTSSIHGAPDREEYRGVTVLRLPSFTLMGGRFPIPKPGLGLIRSLSALRALGPDLFVINTRFFPISAIAAICARSWSVRSIVVEHGTGHFELRSRIFRMLGHLYEHTITFGLRQIAGEFYGVSMAACSWLHHFGLEAKGVIPNSVAISESETSREAARASLMLGKEVFVVSFAGRLIPEKGVLELVEAAKTLHEHDPRVVVCIAGEGPLNDTVASAAAGSSAIRYLGVLTKDGVTELMRASDVFILPSKYPEGLPTSILEAGARCCPVIASDKGGTREIVENGVSGVLLADVSAATVCAAVRRIQADPGLAAGMAAELRSRVEAGYTWVATASRVAALMR